jgi:ankyrin repeat protein
MTSRFTNHESKSISHQSRMKKVLAFVMAVAWAAGAAGQQGDGSTPLLRAVYQGDQAAVRRLIAARADVNAANRLGMTPLLMASRLGNAAVADALLKAGANPHASGPEGETALMAAAGAGSVDIVRALLARGANVNAREEAENQDALMWAADEGHGEVVKVLLAAGADASAAARATALPNFRGDGGRMWTNHASGGLTALMFAARRGHVDVARQLAEAGADLNRANPDGLTALTLAVINDRLDLAAALLERGAAPDAASFYEVVHLHNLRTNETVSEATRPRPDHENTLTPLDLVARMLERGADPNRVATHTLNLDGTGVPEPINETPFVRALKSQDVAVLRLLVARGAAVNAAVAGGQTPLMLALGLGRAPFSGGFGVPPGPYRFDSERSPAEAVKLLLAAGAEVNATTPAGDSALHLAAQAGSVGLIQLLADAGATLDARNKAGFTPLDAASGKRAPGPPARGGGPGGPDRAPMPQPQAIELLQKLAGSR